jgi:hypothetical protein
VIEPDIDKTCAEIASSMDKHLRKKPPKRKIGK